MEATIIEKYLGLDIDSHFADWGKCVDKTVEQANGLWEDWFTGASKLAFLATEKDVIKIPFLYERIPNWDDDTFEYKPYHYNYCELEAEIYSKAKDEGLGMFFAGTEYIGSTKSGVPIYRSERVNVGYEACEYRDDRVSEDSYKKASRIRSERKSYSISVYWLALAYEYYDENKVNQLVDFVKRERINDLHDGNVGFRDNGEPVLLDYSGYHEYDEYDN